MGVCTSRQHDESRYDGWPGVILAGTTVEDSIAESNVKDKCCGRKMMQFETASHTGTLYYKLYCTVCGTTKPDTKKGYVQTDPWHSQTAASTSPARLQPKQKADSSDGKVRDTTMPPPSVEDLPRIPPPLPSNHQESQENQNR